MEEAREGWRVYVRLAVPRYPSERELLRQARTRVERLERTAGELAAVADRLEQERDQARAETETALGEYRRLEAELLREQNGHQRTRRWLARLALRSPCWPSCWPSRPAGMVSASVGTATRRGVAG